MKKERALEILAEVILESSRALIEKWKTIGREVGELRKSDIVFHSVRGMCEVVTVHKDEQMVEIEYTKDDGMPEQIRSRFNDVELITPVERRFDFE